MNGYEPSTPRATLGLIAIAMAAVTMGTLVVLPAELESIRVDPYPVTVAGRADEGAVEAAVSPARVDMPAEVSREGRDHAARTPLAAQAFHGKRHKS